MENQHSALRVVVSPTPVAQPTLSHATDRSAHMQSWIATIAAVALCVGCAAHQPQPESKPSSCPMPAAKTADAGTKSDAAPSPTASPRVVAKLDRRKPCGMHEFETLEAVAALAAVGLVVQGACEGSGDDLTRCVALRRLEVAMTEIAERMCK